MGTTGREFTVDLKTLITILTLMAAIFASYYSTQAKIGRLEEIVQAQQQVLSESCAEQDATTRALLELTVALKVQGVIR